MTTFKLSTTNQSFDLQINISRADTLGIQSLRRSRATASRATYHAIKSLMSDYCVQLLSQRNLQSSEEWFKANATKYVEIDGSEKSIPIIDVSASSAVQSSHEVASVLRNHGWDLIASTLLLNPPSYLGLHLLVRRRP